MSMSYKDIIILLSAGYTKDEISGMDDTQPDPQPAPQPAPKPDPQPAPKPDPQPDLLAALQELTAAVQANNRAAADMGANIIDPIKASQQAMAGIGGLKIN